MAKHLDALRLHRGTADTPNQCSWATGWITTRTRGRFRVVLGLARKGTTGALIGTRNTIDVFRPRHVLLVGTAGALDPRLNNGDIVVAERVFGYEYGKVDGGFRPRPDWCYPADSAIAAIATTTDALHSSWLERLNQRAPGGVPVHPKVVVGPIASGNKVVDDLVDEAFAPVLRMWPTLLAVEMEAWGAVEAIQDAHERNRHTGFSMIRGISDRPLLRSEARRQAAERAAWKAYAAEVAAVYVRFLIETDWPYEARGAG